MCFLNSAKHLKLCLFSKVCQCQQCQVEEQRQNYIYHTILIAFVDDIRLKKKIKFDLIEKNTLIIKTVNKNIIIYFSRT